MDVPDLAPFRLSLQALGDIRRALTERILLGLAADGQEIACLPAYLSPPPADLQGQALVLDAGGTRVRAALVRLEGGGRGTVLRGPEEGQLPSGREAPVTAQQFFDVQAELLARLGPDPGLPLGYCFSYPAAVTADNDARLLRWTKEVEVQEVVGTLVGRSLVQACARRGLSVSRIRVFNDSVAALMAAACTRQAPYHIGLIVGTGTNMAGFFEPGQIPKLPTPWPRPMAVNLESGNYAPPHLTPWDDDLARATDNPGAHRFEKAVSGYYLPYLFARLLPLPGFDPARGAAGLDDLRAGQAGPVAAQVAEALVMRSADLVAAALAGLADCYPGPGQVVVLAEGSTFWKLRGYPERVRATLAALVGDRLTVTGRAEANLIGAACAALS